MRNGLFLASALLLIGLGAHAECPPVAGDELSESIKIPRERVLAFPIGLERGDAITHRGNLQACVFDPATKQPIEGLRFQLIPYVGRVAGRGPERADFELYNHRGPLRTVGNVIDGETSASGEIRQRGLRVGQYALVPDWSTITADEIRVDFRTVNTLDVSLPVGQLITTNGAGAGAGRE